MLAPSLAVMVPASQAIGKVLPVAHDEPAGHVLQLLGDVAPVELRKAPAAQTRAALAPSAQ